MCLFFFQAEDGIRDVAVTGVQTCALPISAVDVSERKERERDIFGGIELEVVADVGDVGAEVSVREHHALGLAGGAGGVDERSELTWKNLGSTHSVRGDVRRARAGDEGFVTETFAGYVRATIGDNKLFEPGKIGAYGEQLLQLGHANDEDDLGTAMLQDVGHAVGRFVE